MPQHGSKGTEEALDIEPEAELFHILPVQPCLHRQGQLVSAVDLRPARQPGLYVVGTVLGSQGIQVILIPQSRPRANDAHVSQEDVENLGQLIQTGFPQKPAHSGDVLLRVLQ